MSKKKLAAQFAWVSVGRLLGALIQAITMLLLARDLGPHKFGIFSAIFGVAIVFQAALDLGIATMVVKDRASNPSNPIIYAALRLTDRLGFVIFSVTVLPLLALGILSDPFFFYLLPLAIWAACERHTDTWLSVPLADGDARINTQNLLIRRTSTILVYLGGVLVGIDAALVFSAAMAFTSFISMLVIRKIVWKRIVISQPPIKFREILRQSWPYWLNSLGTQARNFDTLLVSAVAGPSQAGFYAATSRVTGPLRILSTSMAAVLLPASAAKNPAQITSLLRLVGVMALCCTFLYGGLILIVPQAINFFLGESYRGAILPLQIVLGGLVFAAVASLLNSILQGLGLQLFVAKSAVFTTALCLVLVIFGGLSAAAVGAAIGLSVSFITQSVVLGYRLRKVTSERQNQVLHQV